VPHCCPKTGRAGRHPALRSDADRSDAGAGDRFFEVNGARRWLNLGMSLQPSEFLKPAFAIGIAWILSWRARDPNLPVIALCTGLMGTGRGLLMLQPDFGSTILFGGVWFVLVLLSGISLKRIAALIGGGGFAMVSLTYLFYDNGRHRIDAFLGGGTAFDQVDLAQRTLLAGGWTGSAGSGWARASSRCPRRIPTTSFR
jgi:cell division protein FtsW